MSSSNVETSAVASAAALTPGQERLAVIALATVAFALNLNTNVLGALLPFLPEDMVGAGRGGALIEAAAWASALAALVTGSLADRLGRRLVMLWGLLVFGAASLLHVVADSFVWLYAARALSGAAVGMAYACASALVAEIVPYQRRSGAMGMFTAGMFLAFPIGLPAATLFARSEMWQGIFVSQAVLAVAGALLAMRTIPRGARGNDAAAPAWVDPRRVIFRPSVVPALLAVMLHVGAFFVTVQLSTRWLDEAGLVAKEDQGWLWIVLGLASAMGSFGFGRVADRLGKRRFVLTSSLVLVGAFVLLAQVESFAWLLVVGLLMAVAASARTGPLQALTTGLVPRHQYGTLMGLRAFTMQLGVALFARFAGAFDDLGFRAVFYAAAACQVLSWAAVRFGVREVRT